MKLVRSFSMLAVVSMVPLAYGQDEAPKPGPQHAHLKKLEGTWDTTWSMMGKVEKGVATYKMDLGGLWLASKFESPSPMGGGTFMGRGFDTYDAAKKKYVGVWVDSWSTQPMTFEGTYDESKKTMTMMGEAPGPDGKLAKHKMVYQTSDDNTMSFSMYVGDSKEPMFTIVYKRRK